MAVRLPVRAIWRSSGATTAFLKARPVCHRLTLTSTFSHNVAAARCFSSQGTPPLRNASKPIEELTSTAADKIDTLAEQSNEASTSIMEPFIPLIEQLPELLHLPPSTHSYAISIVILTVILRTAITLPVTLWQRKRIRRMTELVVPKWNSLKVKLPELVAKRCRKQRKSYEEYEVELQKEVREKETALQPMIC